MRAGRLSASLVRRPERRSGRSILLILAALTVIGWGAWEVAASAYRAQHCVLILGHWLSVEQTTLPWFCQ